MPLVALLILSALFTHVASAQDVTIRASTDATTVDRDEVVTYTLKVTGAPMPRIETPEAPEASGLMLLHATPVTQPTYTYAGGTLRRGVIFRWRYRPTRAGMARLGATQVTVEGEAYQTAPIDLRVQPAQTLQQRTPRAPASPTIDSGDIFIRVEADEQQPYVGQQAVLTYRLYYRDGLQPHRSRRIGAWSTPGFWREALHVPTRPVPRRVTIGGEAYRMIALKRAALFPTRAGTLRVAPLRIATTVSSSTLGRFFALLNERIRLSSDTVRLRARPLPESAPAGFDGAVGRFQLKAHLERTNTAAGEAVQLRVTISGVGNLPLLDAPVFDAPPAFDVYGPEVQMTLDRGGERLRGTKTSTYTLVPKQPGTYPLPSIAFAYFDPATERYEVLRASLPALHVTTTVAAAPPAVSATGEGFPVGALAGPLTESTAWVRLGAAPLHARPWVWIALLVPLLMASGLCVYRRRQRRGETERPARQAARLHLATARKARDAGDVHRCADEIERAVRTFIAHRLGCAARGMTREDIIKQLTRAGAPAAARQATNALLGACERTRYAPAAGNGAHDDLINRARVLLDDLDAVLDDERSTTDNRVQSAVSIPVAVLLVVFAGAAPGCTSMWQSEVPRLVLRHFEEGNRYYQVGRYEAARQAYVQVLGAGYASGALYYQLAGAHFQSNRLGQALRYYEKARVLLPRSERLRHNVRLVRSRLGNSPTLPPPPRWQAAGQWISRRIAPYALFWLGLLGYLAGLALWVYRDGTHTTRRGLRRAAVGAFTGGVLLLALGLAGSAGAFTRPRAVLVTEQAAVRTLPTVAADTSALAAEGALLRVLDRRPGWTHVRLPDGATGWLDARTVGGI